MNTFKELGDKWEREALAGVREKRDRLARTAAACRDGGEYGAQILRIVAMYDRMIAAASAQPVSAGLGSSVRALAEKWSRDAIAAGFAGSEPANELFDVLESAAQRDSQPDHIADAGEMVGTSADARDAARYRWLRDIGDATWRPFGIRSGCIAEDADAAIDAAIAASREPTQ